MGSRSPIAERFPRPSVMGIVNVTPDSFSDGATAAGIDQERVCLVHAVRETVEALVVARAVGA